jgi:hypothetical protein
MEGRGLVVKSEVVVEDVVEDWERRRLPGLRGIGEV